MSYFPTVPGHYPPAPNDCLFQTFDALSRCHGRWDVLHAKQINEYRSNASIKIERANLHTYVEPLNAYPPHAAVIQSIGHVPKLVFLRDCVEIPGITRYVYHQLRMRFDKFLFAESEYAIHDAEKRGNTWKCVNKDGTPDGRIKINPEIPLLLYGILTFEFPSAAPHLYMFSSWISTYSFFQCLKSLGVQGYEHPWP